MLDKFRSTDITWDKATSRIYSPITANESDENGRKLVVQIVNSGQVEDLTGATLHLYWETRDKAHDGLDVFKAVDLKKGEFELSYTTGMLSNHGVLNANLVLIDTVGRVVSERFKITVTEGIDNGAIQSENSFSSLTQALIDISNLEQNYAPRLNDLTAQLQQTEAKKADKGEVENKLSFKRDKSVPIGLNDADSDLLTAIQGGTNVEVLSIPRDYSVTPTKTTFLDLKGAGKNKFNPDDVRIIFDKQPASVVLASLGATSFLIPCEPNKTYTISRQVVGTRFQAGYTSTDELVTRQTPVYNTTINDSGNNLTLPPNPNAKYIFCYFWRNADQGEYTDGAIEDIQFQLEEGLIQTDYEPYKELYNLQSEFMPNIDPEKMTILDAKIDKNHFGGDGLVILNGFAVNSTNVYGGKAVSFLIPCEPNKAYTISKRLIGTRFKAGYTDTNNIIDDTPVFGFRENDNGDVITLLPNQNAKYIICYFWRNVDQGTFTTYSLETIKFQVEEGYQATDYEPYKTSLKINASYLPEQDTKPEFRYDLKISAIPDTTRNSLFAEKEVYPTLFAIKTSNSRTVSTGYESHPVPIGWLYYVDEAPYDILYANKYPENMEKIFTWNSEITWDGTSTPKNYSPYITKEGDVIFVYRGEQASSAYSRQNPIVYPAGDYENPIVVDLGEGVKPTSWLQNVGADYIYNQNCFIFGEYTRPVHDMVYTWKVTKPYTNPENWRIVNEYVMDMETGARHFHTTNYDPYTEIIYSTTGDSDGASRVLYSLDYGETWTVLISGSQTHARLLNFVITEDKIYWSTDSQDTVHHLFEAKKDADGLLDVDTTKILYTFPNREAATYTVALIDNPHGLLILNRFDYVSEIPLKVYFWSFEDNRMHVIKEIEPVDYTKVFGFRCESVNWYQSPFEKRIICGFGYFENNMKLFGNSNFDKVGNLALEVVRK